MLTASFLRHVEVNLGRKLGQKLHIKRVTPLSGGSINQSAKIDTSSGAFFMKVNDAFRYPSMFEKEANGLMALRNTKTFTIPDVILTGEEEGNAYLILQYIEARLSRPDFWKLFGRSLAGLHKGTSERFGFNEDNYIGSIVQSNSEKGNWIDFFIEERLEKQLSLALRNGLLSTEDADRFKKLYLKLESYIPVENPALLHGDLWNGNFISGNSGEPCLIDPAVYYGHREMDLAMTKLFGGFDAEFYEAYLEENPLKPGFEERTDIHNLYPLLVHVNLFGESYARQVRSILRRFV